MWTTGPVTSAEAETATAELPDILMDGVRRTRTIPDSQEVAGEEEDEDDEIEELIEGFIASSAGHCVERVHDDESMDYFGFGCREDLDYEYEKIRLPVTDYHC